jgi:Delta3-Delta2-enoyl-CoA isomerase
MKTADLELHRPEGVAVITLDYKQENHFHPDLVGQVLQHLDQIEQNSEIGALVVTGRDPKFFSNGLDLEWMMQNFGEPDRINEYLLAVNRMYKRFTIFPKPTVAALNGHCFAAGLFLAAHMDFRFMRQDRGWICLPEVDINIPLLPGMIAICQAVMTPQGFRKLYYTGQRLTAPQAMEIGFVDGVHTQEELLPKCIEFASMLAKKKMATYSEMKLRIRSHIAKILEEDDPKYFKSTLAIAAKGN